MAPPRKRTKAEFAQALQDARGLISVAAARLGVTPRTVYRMLDQHADLREARSDAMEKLTDFVESKLYQQIAADNISAIIFFLKTRGRNRGYVERIEQSVSHAGPIIVDLTIVDPDEQGN